MTSPDSSSAPPELRGQLHVAERAVQRVAEYAAAEVNSSRRNSSTLAHLRHKDLPNARVQLHSERAIIKLQIAAAWPVDLPAVAQEVRNHVSGTVSRFAGVNVDRVDVSVLHLEHDVARVR